MSIINFLCKNTGLITLCIIDSLLVIAIIATLLYIFLKAKSKRAVSNQSHEKPQEKGFDVEAIVDQSESVLDSNNEVSYAIPEENKNQKPIIVDKPQINKVEHFSNQISDLSEQASNELKAKVTMKPRVSDEPVKRTMKEETINFNQKTENGPLKTQSFEKSSTMFLSTIKSAQNTTEKSTNTKAKLATESKAKTTSVKKTTSSKPKAKTNSSSKPKQTTKSTSTAKKSTSGTKKSETKKDEAN